MMRYFKLPDLGEGLTEAEIVEWHVKGGDVVTADQLMLTVETDKAMVEVPSPQDGKIARLCAEVGDIVHIDEPLVEFEGQTDDAGTVVGTIDTGKPGVSEDSFVVGQPARHRRQRARAAPAVRALASRLGIDISQVRGSGVQGAVLPEDLEKTHRKAAVAEGFERLRGVRRTMARSMTEAHAEVVPVCIFDDADINVWFRRDDTTIRLVQAIAAACAVEPILNSWFDGASVSLRRLSTIDLGIAVNTEDGLFVPVLRDIGNRPADDLRAGLDRLRADVEKRTIPPQEMRGATITLSNFGMIGGRYAGPVVVPPTVAIIGAGQVRSQPVVATDDQLAVHKLMPISLTFDHRAVTGAEGARFLAALRSSLQSGKD